MARVTDEVKRYIVQGLARFLTPSEVAAAVKETFGVEVTRQQVWHYNPANPDVKGDWRELFAATRAAFLVDVDGIGISHKTYRLREIQELYQRIKAKNPVLAAELLEQAAKEDGGMFTNRREVTGKGGGAVQLSVTTPDMAEAQAELAEWRKKQAEELSNLPSAPPT